MFTVAHACRGTRTSRLTRVRSHTLVAVEKVDTSEADESLTGEYTWAIENYSKTKQVKLYSPVFQSGQYNWCAAAALVAATSHSLMRVFAA